MEEGQGDTTAVTVMKDSTIPFRVYTSKEEEDIHQMLATELRRELGLADNALGNRLVEKIIQQSGFDSKKARCIIPVSYTHLTLPTMRLRCRSRWSPDH